VTVIAGLVIAAAVTIGILLLYLLQLDSIRSTVDQQLRTYVSQIAQRGRHPRPERRAGHVHCSGLRR
jgi:hypothetical protein